MFTNLSKGLCLGLLSVLLLISYSSTQSPDNLFWTEIPGLDNMCCIERYNDLTYSYDSVFMLSGDTFFKVKLPNNSYWIYRMNYTRQTEQPYKLFKPWKTAIRVPHIESALRLSLIGLYIKVVLKF